MTFIFDKCTVQFGTFITVLTALYYIQLSKAQPIRNTSNGAGPNAAADRPRDYIIKILKIGIQRNRLILQSRRLLMQQLWSISKEG